MTAPVPPSRLGTLLDHALNEGAFGSIVVSTEQGLPIAVVGDDDATPEALAALTSLFDDIVVRVSRDVGFPAVDEVALRDATDGSLVVRPLGASDDLRLFLVVRVPKGRPWRRVTNRLCRTVGEELAVRRGA